MRVERCSSEKRDGRKADAEAFARQVQATVRERHKLLPNSVDFAGVPFPILDKDALEYTALETDASYISVMGRVVGYMVDLSYPKKGAQLRFDAVTVPEVSIEAYLQRLRQFFACSPECFVLAMIYVDRLTRFHEGVIVPCAINIHRILLTALMLAAKFFDDVYYSNNFYARIGGISAAEMNVLESHFLNLIKYDLFVSPREYERYRRELSMLRPQQPRH